MSRGTSQSLRVWSHLCSDISSPWPNAVSRNGWDHKGESPRRAGPYDAVREAAEHRSLTKNGFDLVVIYTIIQKK